MKTIKNYKEFNESKFDIRANLKPKSKEELEKALKDEYPHLRYGDDDLSEG